MAPTRVSIRELKSRLSHYLRIAKAGGTVEITERGVPIGRIVPTAASVDARLDALIASGLMAWNGESLPSRTPVRRTPGSPSVASLLLEDRE
jgi:prevent-host-death family protein